MKKITPHLWFDKEAKDAVKFYVSIFPTISFIVNFDPYKDKNALKNLNA